MAEQLLMQTGIFRRVSNAFAAATIGALVCTSGALAQSWPSRPIRVLVPLTPGSAVDIVPRIVLEEVGKELGQSFVIENRPGASGALAARAAAQASADGYTLLAHSSALTIAPYTIPNAGYDPAKDFVPVTSLGIVPNVLVVAPPKNINSLRDLVIKARADILTFGTIGIGSPMTIWMDRLQTSAGFSVQNVTFRGAPEALTETMTGRIDFYSSPILAALPFIRDGKLVPLAVSGSHRSAALPDVPTSVELGFAGSDYNFWLGLFAPAGTSPEIVDRLNKAVKTALAKPEIIERLRALAIDPADMSREEFADHVRKETVSFASLAKKTESAPARSN
jgi:tripartite-type tricarboxylate transporter receptor subunit TctC